MYHFLMIIIISYHCQLGFLQNQLNLINKLPTFCAFLLSKFFNFDKSLPAYYAICLILVLAILSLISLFFLLNILDFNMIVYLLWYTNKKMTITYREKNE